MGQCEEKSLGLVTGGKGKSGQDGMQSANIECSFITTSPAMMEQEVLYIISFTNGNRVNIYYLLILCISRAPYTGFLSIYDCVYS